ncbi:MAG: SDR family NAD(P)-dependent oxidoreductase [Candidatus Hodarchaeales archaeon]|jgi:3-oxoacyl-[acyl-carrier protein] reductase
MRMNGETAIITGSTSGIGKKLAEIFLQEGCKVMICSRDESRVKETVSEFKKTFGDSVIGRKCDVTNVEDIKKVLGETAEIFGSIRILVANAGLNTTYGPLEYLSPEQVASDAQFVIGVNLIGTINVITAVLPYMIKQEYGRIITLAGAGVGRPTPNMTLYSASKGGVDIFSKCFAEELKEKEEDIKINIFMPGMIDTNLGKKTQIIADWKDEESFRQETSLVLEHIGTNIDESCKKIIPYVLESCKDNGKQIKGYSLLKMIRGGRKLQKIQKQGKKKTGI